MSLVDYGQTAEDHQSLLILVNHTGSSLPLAAFNRVWDRIRALTAVTVQGQSREVAVRYKRSYPKENNDWGDFQAHRKVLGLVAVGKCVDHEQFAVLFENYKKVKEDYASTIINSRLIIFGMNTDGSPIEQQPTTTTANPATTDSSSSPSHSQHHHQKQQQESCQRDNDSGLGQDQDDSNSKKGQEEEEDIVVEEKDPSSSSSSSHKDKNHSPSPTLSPKCQTKPCSEDTDKKDKKEEEERGGGNINNSRASSAGSECREDSGKTRGGCENEEEKERSSANISKSDRSGGNKNQEEVATTAAAAAGSKVKDEKGSRTEGSSKGQGQSQGQQGGGGGDSSGGGGGGSGGGGGGSGGRPHSNSLTKESTGSEVVFYPSLDQCFDLEERLKEFVTSLFFVLEGKRLERTFERSDRLTLLCAPFEKKDYVGVDTDTKSFKKKVMGRLRKHLGDLCLQASLPGEAMLHYQTALDLLRSVNDFLWMGGCYEGLCSASVVLTKAHAKPTPTLRRNQSFSVKRGTSSPDLKHKASTAGTLRQQVSVSNFSNGVDHLEQETALHCLNPDDIIEKYKEAITNYSKYKNSAMVEMEASIKACRVLIYQRKFLQASDFLQNVVYINLTFTQEDKIQRFSTLSWLYGQIGFRRKEAFFRRVAAMQCVSPGVSQVWGQCYQLLLHALPGYNISLDPHHQSLGENSGWPVIQHRVLHELVFTARRMGNPQIAVRHSTLLLHSQYKHLSPEQQREAVNNLQSLTSKCEGVPQALTLQHSSIILPPIHLTCFPSLRSFKLLSPPAHLRPMKVTSPDDVSPSSIFIYTPLSLGNNSRKGESEKVDFEWVAEDMCEVQLQLYNPLTLDLNILYMGLMTEGVEVEVFPASPSLPSLSPLTVKLMVKPQTAGQLTILGYDTQVFGVSSHCRLRDMGGVAPSMLQVEVVPALPQVTLTCSLPKAPTFAPSSSPEGATVVANASAVMYAGQSQDCVITLHNVSSQPVTSLSLKLDCRNDAREFTDKMFQWSNENIQSQLPLQPGGQLCIAVCLYAHSDFLLPPVTSPDVTSSSISSRSRAESSEKGTQTVEALLCVEYSGGAGLAGGYCRRCCLAVTVDVQASLYITNWDVLPADCGRGVTLVLDLLNVSSHQADVQCDSSSSSQPPAPIIIESQQCRRIAVTIPRVSFPEPGEDEAEKTESRIPVKYRGAWRTPDAHSQFLSTLVHINWAMAAAKVKGKVGVDYLKWTPEQLDSIRQSDINWEVLVNGQHYTAPDLMNFPSSMPVSVSVNLSASKGSYQDVTLTLEPGQEGQGEGQPLDMDAFVCVGAHTAWTDELTPDKPLRHAASFLFFCPGRYQFSVRCSARHSSSSTDSMDDDSLSVVNSQHQRDSQYDSQDGGDGDDDDGDNDNGGDGGDFAVFVCLPPPLFTVTDHSLDHSLHL